jgi:hypothetical protein
MTKKKHQLHSCDDDYLPLLLPAIDGNCSRRIAKHGGRQSKPSVPKVKPWFFVVAEKHTENTPAADKRLIFFMFESLNSKMIRGATEVDGLERLEGELLAPRLAAINIVVQPMKGKEGEIYQRHAWQPATSLPHAWSRAHASYMFT